VSEDLSSSEPLRGVAGGTHRMLRVESVFRVTDELHGQTIAAKLIDRVHEIANLPECECDVDVSVEWVKPDDLAEPRGVPSGGVPIGGEPTAARPAER
jgi:hypothetical protein